MLNLNFGVCVVWGYPSSKMHIIFPSSVRRQPDPYHIVHGCVLYGHFTFSKKKDNKRVRAFIHTPFNFMSKKEKCRASICRYSNLINGALMCLDYVGGG